MRRAYASDEELRRRRFDLAADPHYWRESGIAIGFDHIPQHCYLHLFHLDWHRNVWVHAQHAQEHKYQPGLRERLVLPQAHRDLIDILTADRSFIVEDVVPNKSGGTTILCKGAPGSARPSPPRSMRRWSESLCIACIRASSA